MDEVCVLETDPRLLVVRYNTEEGSLLYLAPAANIYEPLQPGDTWELAYGKEVV